MRWPLLSGSRSKPVQASAGSLTWHGDGDDPRQSGVDKSHHARGYCQPASTAGNWKGCPNVYRLNSQHCLWINPCVYGRLKLTTELGPTKIGTRDRHRESLLSHSRIHWLLSYKIAQWFNCQKGPRSIKAGICKTKAPCINKNTEIHEIQKLSK